MNDDYFNFIYGQKLRFSSNLAKILTMRDCGRSEAVGKNDLCCVFCFAFCDLVMCGGVFVGGDEW